MNLKHFLSILNRAFYLVISPDKSMTMESRKYKLLLKYSAAYVAHYKRTRTERTFFSFQKKIEFFLWISFFFALRASLVVEGFFSMTDLCEREKGTESEKLTCAKMKSKAVVVVSRLRCRVNLHSHDIENFQLTAHPKLFLLVSCERVKYLVLKQHSFLDFRVLRARGRRFCPCSGTLPTRREKTDDFDDEKLCGSYHPWYGCECRRGIRWRRCWQGEPISKSWPNGF